MTVDEMISQIERDNRYRRPYIRVADRKVKEYNVEGFGTVRAEPRVYSKTWSRWIYSTDVKTLKRSLRA